mmetsp:Transcript_42945/g.100884  ORF Transcript_42945/g.100884 Transcript_42945/m.100884 type:complete len:762 (+) Transcript_42945:199-2484(+)
MYGDTAFLQQAFVGDDEDVALQRALKQSAEEAAGRCSAATANPGGLSEEQALLQALRESSNGQSIGIRKLMRAEGPFMPAGLVNSGNSCFWNALLQVLFAATPVLRGALFQLEEKAKVGDPVLDMQALCLMRDLFAEMDMGLSDAIDAGALYHRIFQTREEADVAEQMHNVFRLTLSGPSPLRSVFCELFSGDLYEHLSQGSPSVRSLPLELCQLDLCVTTPSSLESLLEEHTRDVHGSIKRRSYRLPPVLWLNLDRFVYDPATQQGRKRDVQVTIPEVLNTWMLMPPDAPWLARVREKAQRVQDLQQQLESNFEEVARHGPRDGESCSPEVERLLCNLVERQEALVAQLDKAEKELARSGAEQELLYHLEAVIVHRGQVDSGHYFSYARSPDGDQPGNLGWCCLSDSSVHPCSLEDMRRVCEGGETVGIEDPSLPQKAPSSDQDFALALPDRAALSDASTQAEGWTLVGGSRAADTEGSPRSSAEGLPVNVSATAPLNPKPQRKRGIVASLTSALGCFPRPGSRQAGMVSDVAAPPMSQGGEGCGRSAAGGNSPHAEGIQRPQAMPPKPSTAPRPSPSTSARCLIYVRRGEGGSNLLEEVKLRVPRPLQEKIDVQNRELLRANVEKVADDFVRCIRRLTAHVPYNNPSNSVDDSACPQALEEALGMAMTVRADGGMSMARMYLLREAWRLHIPWLPEELAPATTPPDFRMHYGSAAKRFLLDALIKRGQHDVASLLTADAQRADVLVPSEVASWLSSRGL